MKSSRLWGLVLALASTHFDGVASSPDVRVELRTSWSRPPVFVEVLETIAAEVSQPDAFFTLLNALTDPSLEPQHVVKHSDTPKQIYDLCLWTALQAGYLWETGTLSEAEMSVALHSAQPRVESAYQYYLDREAERVREAQKDGACESWVDWYGQVVCDGKTLAALVELEEIEGTASTTGNYSTSSPRLLPFDHVLPAPTPGVDRPSRTAILYGSPLSQNFRELHEPLFMISNGPSPHVEYIFRHAPSTIRQEIPQRASLSGYGVALDLKKMEYLALDDRIQGGNSQFSKSSGDSEALLEVDPIVALIHQYPEPADISYSEALTESELSQIAFKATQLLYDSDDALSTLKQISQNFPKYASAIARRVTIQQDLEEEVQANHAKAQPGVSMVWLNGLVVPETEMNPFALLRLMKKERNVIRATEALGLSSSQSIDFLTHRAIGLAQSENGVLDGVSDASDRPEGEGVIVWWNDIETDKRYERWNPALKMLLAPMYPGQFPNVKLNLFNVVLAIDLSQMSSVNFIAGAVNMIIQRGFPFRFGVVPLVETEQGTQMARLFYWLIEHVGRTKTMSLFSKVAQLQLPVELLTYNVDWQLLRTEFDALVADLEEDVDFNSIIKPPADLDVHDEIFEKTRQYAKRLSTDLESSIQGHAFVNGKHFELNDEFLRSMQVEASQQLQHLQEKVYLGVIGDEESERMATYFYDLPSTSKRRNRFIYPAAKSNGIGGLHIVNLMDLYQSSQFPISSGSFLHPPGSLRLNASTFVVADFNSDDGVALLKEVLQSMNSNTQSRYTFVHNPSIDSLGVEPTLASVLGSLITTSSLKQVAPAQILEAIATGTLDKREDGQTVFRLESVSNSITGVLSELDGMEYERYIRASSAVVGMLKLAPGEQALVVNGRVVGPFGRGDFVDEDFQDLINYEVRKRIGPVVDALAEVMNIADEYDQNAYNGLVSMASSLISSIHLPDPSEAGLFNAPIRPRRRNYQSLASNFTKFEYGDNSTAPFHFGVILDPLSEAAQKWSALLEWLIQSPGVFVEIHINPPKYNELPLKRFYRYNVQATPQFDEKGEELTSAVSFDGLPKEPIYTLAMDVVQSWHVRPREASHDLDNILLNTLTPSSSVHAKFSLDYLVIEGHAREEHLMQPPRGLQLQLVDSNDTAVADTLVVANLGYLQFRAKPGVYRFEIRPGRGREIFRLASAGTEGWESQSVEEAGNEITLMSFEGLTLYPRTVRLEGMEGVDVLAADEPAVDEEESFLDKFKNGVSSLFGTKEASTSLEVVSDGQADINIFTVASGLLYERFASIMILSVLRNTKSTVKFWFIENFLSPSFLEFIPHFASAYNFQYELVTYKWPSWLRAQKEKQRIIWAYKILFLDVLFPMDLKKVIFVDADQIVRADLKELVELDLHGAPYGYTPMGDDNTEMEGFRFWKTGYWRDFLRGLPYHISALYVVDLVRFRQIAAGDILRTHYQQLSADPNSLANLDQDLPNNLQREVPIFSLPEDWLWCETWCSKDRLDRAKTIDLCQNPLTKEPKLARAKHIPEWEEYDSEISRFAKQLSERGAIHAGMADADASVLADVGSASAKPEMGELLDSIVPEDDSTAVHHKKDEL
ncbi:glycosyltransferase family 24 protein [Irpex rosettiformis]|uniref:Glycosyltransferase family 24 protein n=1 Tax=Irpex rosettiformis TaxID=378272 RepID=A0ACB8U755_9APHY|nr:glycosyltransferase family 24 protein [Irpex rosettiformis]